MAKTILRLFTLLLVFCMGSILFGQTTTIYTEYFTPPSTPNTLPTNWLITHAGTSDDWTLFWLDETPPGLDNDKWCMGFINTKTEPANAWAILQGIYLTAGYDYHVEFYQKNMNPTNHKIRVTVGNEQSIVAQTTQLLDLSASNTVYTNRSSSFFTPSVSGTYFFALNCYSDPSTSYMLVDLLTVYQTIAAVPNPINFLATPIRHNQIDLSWTKFSSSDNVLVACNTEDAFGTPVDETTYNVGTTIPSGGGEVIYNGSGSAFSHTSLTANTHYYYKAWSVSSSNEYSTGKTADAVTFRTPVTLETDNDFTQGFDEITFPPGDWSTTGDWVNVPGKYEGPADWHRYIEGYGTLGYLQLGVYCYPASGAGMAGFGFGTALWPVNAKGILVTPPLNIPAEGFKVEFKMYLDHYLDNPEKLSVYYNTTNNTTGAIRLGDPIYRYNAQYPQVPDGWYTYTFSLPTGSAGEYRYLIFEAQSAYGNKIYIDDVRIFYDEPLPVELSAFFVNLSISNLPLLTWITQTETNMAGFRLYRGLSNDLSQAELLSAFIAGSNTTQQQSYVYHDTEPYYNATYYYWLESADLDGSSEFFGPVSIALDFTYVNPPTIPLVTELSSVYPNPFNPETTISYTVAKRSEVQLSIYNVKGQLVRRLVQDFRNPGHYRVNWNGRDEQSRLCGSGSYQIVMRVGTDVFTRKALLLK